MIAVLPVLAAIAAALSVGISLWQHVCALRFRFHRGDPAVPANFRYPSITVLKPLKGCDPELLRSLETWLVQDYPGRVEILFGVASAEDPVHDAVLGLISRHPGCEARLLVCPPDRASNPKVSTLTQLSALAAGEVVVVSDADVRAPSNLLRHIAATLSQDRVGLAHCFYRLANPQGLAMRLESLGVNADFWASAAQARSLGMVDFALGAVMGLRREVLEEIGGFPEIAHFLADDFQLGNLVARTGRRIEFCATPVSCHSRPAAWLDVWRHQLRWTRTVRICKPGPFLLSITGNPTLWPLLWLVTGGRSEAAILLFAGWMSVRVGLAHQRARRLAGDAPGRTDAWLAPVQDLIQAVLWGTAQVGNSVTWQGQKYRVHPGGHMERMDEPDSIPCEVQTLNAPTPDR
jgi:ceramide glucosyltransferase